MAYKYETQYNSPSYTPRSQTRAVWGVDRKVTAIAIHWWDDPLKKPSYEGVIATLCNPARQASAHFVATGTGRRVACLVSPNDNSWATNQANPFTISIECDPRCRPEDYDVVAELIADIRSAYGNFPLVPHSKYVATRCPGNWDLVKLDKLAKTKFSAPIEWGKGGDIKPKPVITTKEEIKSEIIPYTKETVDDERLLVGDNRIIPGHVGTRTIVYTVTYTDGKETKRVVKSDITIDPVTETTINGTFVEPPVIPEIPEIPEPPVEPPKNTDQSALINFLTWLVKKILAYISSRIKRIK